MARAMHGIDVGGDRPRAEVVLWTDDVDAAFAAVVAAGARPLAEPHDFPGSVRAAWVAGAQGEYGPSLLVTDIQISFEIPKAVVQTVKRR